jgi:adenine-specific DNA-methyltransferase
MAATGRRSTTGQRAETYLHEEKAVLRPEVGTQPQFNKRKQPMKYTYDDSLSPAMDWDGQNPGREIGEWLLALIDEAVHLDPPHRSPSLAGAVT